MIIGAIISYFISNILTYILSNLIKLIFEKNELLPITIPNYIFGILFTPFIFLLMRKIIHSKMKEGITDSIYIGTEYKTISKIMYNNMNWIVQKDIYPPKYIHIKYTPLCPKCGAELYYQEHDLWYSYDCVNPKCSFIKKTWESNDKMRSKAKMLYNYERKKIKR